VIPLPEGKMRVTSNSWDGERVLPHDQVVEVRRVNSRLHVTRKERHWDRPTEPYDPYGPGAGAFDDVTGYAEAVTITATSDASHAFRGRKRDARRNKS
jgi:hypothetical protein